MHLVLEQAEEEEEEEETDLVVLIVPISNHYVVIIVWQIKRNGDDVTVIDADRPITPCSPLEVEAGEVEIAPNLILHLENVRPVPPRLYRAVRPPYSVVPRIPPHLHSVPVHTKKNRSK